jgi:HEAT repeat protein
VHDLSDPDPNVREQACTALAEHPDPAALRQLVDLAASDPDHQVRLEACWALGALGDPSAVPVLSELALCPAEDAEMPELAEIIYLKVAAACALVRIGGEDAEGTIERLAHSGEDLDPALASLALAAHGEPAVIPQIAALIADPEFGADVAGFVVPHLGRFGVDAVPAYLAALDIEGWPSRHCVFWLAQIGDGAIPPVEAYVRDDARSHVSRRRAALSLYWMPGPEAANARDRLSNDQALPPEVRDALVLPRPWGHDQHTEGD